MRYPAYTTLQTAVSAGATAITPYSLQGLTAPCYLVIETEIVFCPTAPVSGSFTGVTRGALGTTAASHAASVAIYGLYSNLYPFSAGPEFSDAIAAELATLEARASSGGGGVTAVTGTAPIASSGGATPDISIAAATALALGAVQPDGVTIEVVAGVISVPTATTSLLGLVKPDGTTITIAAGVISAAGGSGVMAVTGTAPIASSGGTTPNITIATATALALGVVKPDGTTILVTAGTISVPTATTGALGLVKPDGTSITISAGVISAPNTGVSLVTGSAPIASSGGATPNITVGTATALALGVVQPDGTTIIISSGVISVPTATTSALGLVKPDGTTITISAGVISAAGGGALTRIAQTVLSVATASVTFGSIPGSYSSLLLVVLAKTADAGATAAIAMEFNSDTGSNFGSQNVYGNSSTAAALQGGPGAAPTSVSGFSVAGNANAAWPGLAEVLIPGYAATTFNKIALSGWGIANPSGSMYASQLMYQWASTAAINAIKLLPASGANFDAGSTFTLYGIQ